MQIESESYKKLKVNPPMLHSYTVLGTIFSIAEEKDMPYFYNGFVQLKYHEEWEMFVFDAHQDLLEVCPFLNTEHYVFDEDVDNEEIIRKLIKFIERDYYIYIFLDWHYLIPKEVQHNFAHTTLISGYDKEKGTFFVSDNLDNGKFVTIEVEMETVTNAFKSSWKSSVGNAYDNDGSSYFDYLKTVTVFKYRNEVQINFNKDLLISEIKSYLYSLNDNLFYPSDAKLCGMNSYDVLINSLDGSKDYKVTRRDYHMIYEHKVLMNKRVEYLCKYKYIVNKSMLLEKSKEIMNGFLIVRNLILKKSVVEKNKKLDLEQKVKTYLEELLEIEKSVLEDLLQELE